MGLTIRMSWIREMTKNIEVVENMDFGIQFNHEVKDLNLQKQILMILLIINVFSIIISWKKKRTNPERQYTTYDLSITTDQLLFPRVNL